MVVNIQHSEHNRGSPGDFSGEGGQSDGTTWLFQAALHQQVSPQTGRKISKQRKQQQGIMQGQSKKGNSSEDDQEMIWPVYVWTKHNIPSVFVCHIYYVFFPSNNPALRWHFHYSTHTFWAPPPSLIKGDTNTHVALYHCNSVTFEKEKAKDFQWHLCWLEECIPVCLGCVILHDISIMCGTDIIFSVRLAVLFKYMSPVFPERVNYN